MCEACLVVVVVVVVVVDRLHVSVYSTVPAERCQVELRKMHGMMQHLKLKCLSIRKKRSCLDKNKFPSAALSAPALLVL
jgi:hypothetical protein